uniref:Putative secreted protein n=1 Tax=Anopheles marajoara TaxID=58244 RepID=A0A2M4CAW4_9DIPT
MTTAATVTAAWRCAPSASARHCSTVSCPSACGRSDRWPSLHDSPSVACFGSGANRCPIVPPSGDGDGRHHHHHRRQQRSDPGCC